MHRIESVASRNPRFVAGVAGLLVMASFAGGCGESPADDRTVAFDRTAVQREMDTMVKEGVPGVVTLVREGDQTATLTAGSADLETSAPVESDDRFRIGSLTKPYVGAIIMQLVEEGKLSLDDTVEELLPGRIPNGDRITLKQVMRHESGIAEYFGPKVLKPYLAGDLGHVWTPDQLIDIAVAEGPLFPPGTDVSYSNTNYAVAGKIIEKATGKTLEEEMESRIFEPLSLDDTSFVTDAGIEKPFANGYLVGNGKPQDVTALTPFYWGAGNIVSTAGDVSAFYSALFDGELVSEDSLAEMKDTVAENAEVGQGIGLVDGDFSCGHGYGHDGSVPGYYSGAFELDSGRQLVFLANSITLDDTIASPKAQKSLGKMVEAAICS